MPAAVQAIDSDDRRGGSTHSADNDAGALPEQQRRKAPYDPRNIRHFRRVPESTRAARGRHPFHGGDPRIGTGHRLKFIPGHGSVVGREAIAAQRDMIVDVVDRVKKMISEDKTRDEVLTARLTASYDARVPDGLDQLPRGTAATADRFVDAVYSELKPKR
jgi:hypothetical protein